MPALDLRAFLDALRACPETVLSDHVGFIIKRLTAKCAVAPSPVRCDPGATAAVLQKSGHAHARRHRSYIPDPAPPEHSDIRWGNPPPHPQSADVHARSSWAAGSRSRRQLRSVGRQRVTHLNRAGQFRRRFFNTSSGFSPALRFPTPA